MNFKAIASMEFSFDINFHLICSYDGCLFMKNCWKLLQKNSGKFEFHEFWSIEWSSDQSVWFDWYSIASQSIECSFPINQATIEYQSGQANCLVRIFYFFLPIETYIWSIENCEFWIFLSVFTWIKCKAVCDYNTHDF